MPARSVPHLPLPPSLLLAISFYHRGLTNVNISVKILSVMAMGKVERKPFVKRYALRRPYKRAKIAQVSVPWLVIEREAAEREMTPEEFVANFDAECLFDDFEGIQYRFVPKNRLLSIDGGFAARAMLTEELERRQTSSRLSDTDFARLLGISPSMWSRVKKGERQLGPKTTIEVLRAFPDLEGKCLESLGIEVPVG